MADILATIPLSAIRVFEAAARLRSFTRAAEELGVTQAAVSWQVKALEKRLNQSLFQRLPREVALTAAGERLARASTEAVNVLRAAFSDLTETDDGVLAITTLQSIATQWLAPRIGSFQIAHPRIAVRMEGDGRLLNLVQDGFDVAIRSGDGDWTGLESHFLFPAESTPLCTPEVRDRLGGLADPSDLLSAPLIGANDEWERWFAAAGVRQAAARAGPARLSGDTQVIEMASAFAGQGVAMASPTLFALEIAQGRLVRPFAPTIVFGGGYWLAYPKDRRRSPKIIAFRDWMLATVAGGSA